MSQKRWSALAVAIAGTLAVCSGLTLLPRLLEAAGTVTNCNNQVDLQNKLAGGGLVTFNCGGENAPSTIRVTSTLIITQPTTIDGGGVITLDGQNARRIISASAPLTLVNLTLWRGNATGYFSYENYGGALYSTSAVTLDRVTVLSNTAKWSGGGVSAITATVIGSDFLRNAASSGGGLNVSSGTIIASIFQGNIARDYYGGGLYASSGTIIASAFEGNAARDEGGGLYASRSVTIIASAFEGNSILPVADTSRFYWQRGGGLYASSASITSSAFLSNTAGSGGGLYADGASITGSAFQGNFASESGGGLSTITATISASTFQDNFANQGGAIRAAGPLTLTNNTLHANSALVGSAIFNASARQPTRLAFSTVTDNLANSGTIATSGGGRILANSIVSGTSPVCTGTATGTNEGVNFVSDTTCGTATQVDPKLGPLADNGGLTLTRALLVTSPAIDAATGACPATDQRGVPRPQGAACDVGAYERSLQQLVPLASLNQPAG